MNHLFTLLKETRIKLSISQVNLAAQSKVSLPTIQNIETYRANPSIETLEALASSLGMEVKLVFKPADWDLLTSYGVPLFSKESKILPILHIEALVQSLKSACLELSCTEVIPDRERKLEAIQAFLLAIQSHYPTFFEKHFAGSILVSQLLPAKFNARLVKLRRLSLARLSEYL